MFAHLTKVITHSLVVTALCLGITTTASAGDRGTRLILKEASTIAPRGLAPRRAKASYVGGWHGSLLLQFNTCGVNAPRSFLFRHTLSLSGNRVTLRTSHDGTLAGISRDKGRKIEASRRMTLNNGVQASVGVVYQNLRGNVTGIGYAIEYTFGGQTCRVGYAGNGIRAF